MEGAEDEEDEAGATAGAVAASPAGAAEVADGWIVGIGTGTAELEADETGAGATTGAEEGGRDFSK